MPPSANNLYPSRGGHRHKSAEYRAWLYQFRKWFLVNVRDVELASAMCKAAVQQRHAIVVHARFYFPRQAVICKDGTPKRNDTSNRLKALHDALADALGVDDSYFWDGGFEKLITNSSDAYACVDISTRPIPAAP